MDATPAGTGVWRDPDRVEKLKKLWGEGYSATQIASMLGCVSRNAVIGKVHRLGLPLRGQVFRGQGRKSLPRPREKKTSGPRRVAKRSPLWSVLEEMKAAPERLPVEEPAPDLASLVKFEDLTDKQCRYPHGDPKHPDFAFCGKPQAPGLKYCAHHALKCHGVEVPPRESVVPRAGDAWSRSGKRIKTTERV